MVHIIINKSDYSINNLKSINLPIYIYAIFATALILHSIITFSSIKKIRESNPNYAEYKEIKYAEKIANKVVKQKDKQNKKENKK